MAANLWKCPNCGEQWHKVGQRNIIHYVTNCVMVRKGRYKPACCPDCQTQETLTWIPEWATNLGKDETAIFI